MSSPTSNGGGNGKDDQQQWWDECNELGEDNVTVFYDDGSQQELTLEDWLWGESGGD